MLRCMLRAKIHIATVTGANLAYEGSISIDETILRKADILPYEQVMISNLNNGERFETYAIPAKKGSREICLHGPTARKGIIGDKIIIFCYNYCEDGKLKGYTPTIVFLDEKNKVLRVK